MRESTAGVRPQKQPPSKNAEDDSMLVHARRALEGLVGHALAWDQTVREVTREAALEPHLARAGQELRELRDCRDHMLVKLEALTCAKATNWQRRRQDFERARRQLVTAWNGFVRRAHRLRESTRT